MPKRADFCTLTPDFPQKAFMVCLFILYRDQVLGIVPVDAIYTDSFAASSGVSDTVKQFTTIDHGVTIPNECLLIPLNFISPYPLRKEFWTEPTIEYNSQMRMKTFSPVIDHPLFYSLLVTPFAFDDKTDTWYLHAALPITHHKDIKTIERFMLSSDHVVEPRAKYAAIYSMEKKLRFNWKTGDIKQFDYTAKKLSQSDN